MRHIIMSLAVTALTLTSLAAQDERPKRVDSVPILRDIPLIDSVFRQDASSRQRKIALPAHVLERLPEGGGKLGDLPFGIRHPLEELRNRFPGIVSVELVETTSRRFGVSNAQPRREAHLELIGKADFGEVKAWLDGALLGERLQVLVESRLIFREGKIKPATERAVRVQFAEDDVIKKLEASLRTVGTTMVSSPSVLVNSGQRASVSVLNQTSYVKDFDIEIAEGALIADPVVDVISDGVVIDLCPVFDPSTKEIALSAALSLSVLERPMRTVSASLIDGGAKMTVQVPSLETTSWSSQTLVLTEKKPWCIVQGLPTRFPKGEEVKDGVLELWMRVEVLDPQKARAEDTSDGRIMAFDPDQELYFVKWGQQHAMGLEGGTVLEILRDGKRIGALEVEPSQGQVQACRMLDGGGQRGDWVRIAR